MKKILALLLAVVMVLGMVACASKTEAPAETTTTEPAAETTTEETKTEEPAKEEETATEEQPAEEGVIKKVALVTDVRASMTFDALFQALQKLDEMHLQYSIYYIEASTEVIIKRFKETRRLHPLMRDGTPVLQAVERERQLLEPVRTRASAIIDTTNLSTGKLRGKLIDLVAGGVRERAMHVTVLSFGFKYGLPLDADLVFDVRFLPNPYYIPALKTQTGLDEPVRNFIFQYQQTKDFLEKTEDLLTFLLPNYVDEGKTDLVIAVGCTGGQHRSACIAKELYDFISRRGYCANLSHRDMNRSRG